jgi:hypothetical protein
LAQTFFAKLLQTYLARECGYSLAEIRSRVQHSLALRPPDHFLLIEPNEQFRVILAAEINEATGRPVTAVGFEDCADPARLAGAAPVAMYVQAGDVRASLPAHHSCLLLRSRPVVEFLPREHLSSPERLVAVVSRWLEFLRWARAVLVAHSVEPEALSFRDARERGWQQGLRAGSLIITDAETARHLPAACQARVFRIIADASLAELRSFVEKFLTTPAS